MKIVIIQNTNKEFWPAFKVSKDHINAIKSTFPKASVSVVDDTYARKGTPFEAEIIITTPFFLETLSTVILRTKSEGSPTNVGTDIKSEILRGVYTERSERAQNDKLKWIHLTSAGVDRLPQKFRDSDVLVTNSSGVHPIPISEHVFSFILMFARGIHISFRHQIEKGEWERNFQKFNVAELPDQTIGIVGYGNIGKEVGRLARLFRMKILVVTSKNGNLNDLLKSSDYVVNCLPLTSNTLHFFDRTKLSKMKNSAFFINIGRGKTVDEKALIDTLKSGKIAGAGLDVTEVEPLPKSSPLWKLDNVILTPHYSGWTPHYMDRVIEIFCKNLKAYLKGQKLPNLVDKKRGY